MVKVYKHYTCGCGFETDNEKKAIKHTKNTRQTKGGKIKKGHLLDIRGSITDG